MKKYFLPGLKVGLPLQLALVMVLVNIIGSKSLAGWECLILSMGFSILVIVVNLLIVFMKVSYEETLACNMELNRLELAEAAAVPYERRRSKERRSDPARKLSGRRISDWVLIEAPQPV